LGFGFTGGAGFLTAIAPESSYISVSACFVSSIFPALANLAGGAFFTAGGFIGASPNASAPKSLSKS
jgi:hypothetical protein